MIRGMHWKLPVGDERSRDKLSAGLARVFESNMWECYAAKKMFASDALNPCTIAEGATMKRGKRTTTTGAFCS